MKWRSLTSAERHLAYVWGGLVLAVVALRPLLPQAATYLPPCALRTIAGVPCPTCGATRATIAVLDGRPLDAVILNPMVAGGVLFFLFLGGLAPLWAWRRLEIPVFDRLPMWARIGILAGIAANWIWVIVHLR